MMKKNYSPTQAQGHKAEREACYFLHGKGYRLLQKNFWTRFGEIDLIMANDETVVFVEVRLRNSVIFLKGIETVDRSKQKRIIKSALVYLQKNPDYRQVRFDVIAIESKPNRNEIVWIKDAFQVQ